MKGGKLIGTGSSSCVLFPNIPCLNGNEGDIDNKKISKIIYRKDAKKYSNYEEKMNKIIKKIKNNEKWSYTYEVFCKPLSLHDINILDSNGIRSCLSKTSEIDNSNFDENSYMMIGKYGGEDLDDYFYKKFISKWNIPKKNLEMDFLDLMKKMKSLFLGVKEMNKNNIVHNDIKPGNIIIDNSLKFIDFGLSGLISNKIHFKNRSLREFSTSRLYLYYSIEYLFYYSETNDLKRELDNIVNETYFRYNFDVLNEIYRMFGMDLTSETNIVIDKIIGNEINEKEMIKGIDVYSLGIIIPLLFNETSNPTPFKSSDMIFEFYQLFGEMIKTLSSERIKIDEAYKRFNQLIKKYEKTNKKISSKSKKKSKKKKIRRNK